MATPILKEKRYGIKISAKKKKGESVNSVTRTLSDMNEDYISDPANPDALVGKLQPLITDTVTGFTIVTEQEYALSAESATVQAGINEWENELNNMKLINYYTDGDENRKENIARPSTNQTEATYKKYADERAASYGNWDALYGDVVGTSDTKVWQAD